MGVIYLYIDYREADFIKNIGSLDNKLDIKYKVVNLPIGDFVFTELAETKDVSEVKEVTLESETEGDTTPVWNNGNVLLIVERKTISDLGASIIDGRFREQKARLEETLEGDASKIMYLLEGPNIKMQQHKNAVGIRGAVLNMLFKHKYKMLQTANLQDTVNYILTLYKKFASGDFQTQTESGMSIKSISKSEKINQSLFSMQLSVIPGVSFNMASEIAKSYSSMRALLDAYEVCIDTPEKETMLSGIQITPKRKLGKALSKRIYEALHS